MVDTERLIAEYSEDMAYGMMTCEVWAYEKPYPYLAVCIRSEFIGEWAGSDEDELWQEINSYDWEEPDEFPETQDEFTDYLAFCAQHIVGEFDHRLEKHTALLIAEGERYFKRHHASPTLEWLLDNYPKAQFSSPSPKFKQRVAKAVLQHFQGRSQQLTLF